MRSCSAITVWHLSTGISAWSGNVFFQCPCAPTPACAQARGPSPRSDARPQARDASREDNVSEECDFCVLAGHIL